MIWDAQNKSVTEETGKARDAVRQLDLSDRPWDNGWGLPGKDTDTLESHPYLFSRTWGGGRPEGGKPFFLSDLARHPRHTRAPCRAGQALQSDRHQ